MDIYNSNCADSGSSDAIDAVIKAVLRNGGSADEIMSALRMFGHKKGSVLRLSADAFLDSPIGSGEIHDIDTAAAYLCGRDASVLLDCIGRLGGGRVVLEVSGGFSSLLSAAGSGYMFGQLRKNEAGILSAVRRVNSRTADLIKSAVGSGLRIVSLADPSALVSVIGEKRVGIFSAQPSLELLRELTGIKVVHLCPRTSVVLEKHCGCVFRPHARVRDTVIEEMKELSERDTLAVTGHACIGAGGGCPLFIMAN